MLFKPPCVWRLSRQPLLTNTTLWLSQGRGSRGSGGARSAPEPTGPGVSHRGRKEGRPARQAAGVHSHVGSRMEEQGESGRAGGSRKWRGPWEKLWGRGALGLLGIARGNCRGRMLSIPTATAGKRGGPQGPQRPSPRLQVQLRPQTQNPGSSIQRWATQPHCGVLGAPQCQCQTNC